MRNTTALVWNLHGGIRPADHRSMRADRFGRARSTAADRHRGDHAPGRHFQDHRCRRGVLGATLTAAESTPRLTDGRLDPPAPDVVVLRKVAG